MSEFFRNPKMRRFANLFSRNKQRAQHNLGVYNVPLPPGASKMFRKPALHILDAYYEGWQYDHKFPWDQSMAAGGENIPLREKRPRINYMFAKVLAQRLTAKLAGRATFPSFLVEEDPNTTEYLRYIVSAARLRFRLIEPLRRMINAGSVLVRYYFVEGRIMVEHYLSKYCYPVFQANGDLQSVRIQYVYDDEEDKDDQGRPKQKWYRLDLGQATDVLYDNPEFDKDHDPVFTPVSTVEHALGFVQAEWLRTSEDAMDPNGNPDGYSLIADILDFIDELNYSLSQSSTASSYNQDPQVVLKGVDEDDIDKLVRSSHKAWTLPRKESDASFLESNMNGVTVAIDLRDKMRLNLQDIARIVLLDPEKMAAHAQSGRAMEMLHGPMVDLVDELRSPVEHSFKLLVAKMALTNLMLAQRGQPTAVTIPPGYRPASLDVTVSWPPMFPMTMLDLQQKVGMVSAATSANLISRETGTRYLAKDFNVDNVDEELAKIAAQPVINPFGMF